MVDTIVALSSGTLPSGVAVIRLSGPAVPFVLGVVAGRSPRPRVMTLANIALDSQVIDRGLIAYFPAPNSFTGEDCAELQVHGSPAVVRALLRGLSAMDGVRLADAGEFTRRAFENGKLDATEVEGIADMLAAETENQRRQALTRMTGGLSQKLVGWRETLLDLRAEIEARIDFSDEGDVSSALPQKFTEDLLALQDAIAEVLDGMGRGQAMRDGLRIALAGAPNAGKSSLLNALAKSDIAIVTDEPGTTRDVRDVSIDLGGQLVVLTDTAGIRETDSKAEAEGIRRALVAMGQADLVLWLQAPDDTGAEVLPELPVAVWVIETKADLSTPKDFGISTQSGEGMDQLLSRLRDFVSDRVGQGEPSLVSHERDRSGLMAALGALGDAEQQVATPELAAEALRIASTDLERLLGRIDSEQVLDRLFAGFCIGK